METPLIVAEAPLAYRFSPHNAAEMARRSWDKRRAKKAEALANPPPEPIKIAPMNAQSDYVMEQKTITREMITSVNADIRAELAKPDKDTKALEQMGRLLDTLSERERILDNRPLPGSHRPVRERANKRDEGFGPV